MNLPLLTVRIRDEDDVVTARRRTRQLAEVLGFDTQQQTRLATAVSEIARNAFSYAGGGRADFSLAGATAPQLFTIRISDDGKGIANVEEVLEGRYRSETGMGLGILGARRLMDRFHIESVASGAQPAGTVVTMAKLLPKRSALIAPQALPTLLATLEMQKPRELLEDFREQNRELLLTLDELQKRQDELTVVNQELEDTNRGVVALYAELDEKADHLRRADEVKSRFLSNMSHEFRTPLNSIMALARILLDRMDGELTTEQELQVNYIRKSAESLSELVDDLLDIAKVEAGKTEIHPTEFDISAMFGALRGMLRPLLLTSALNLVFEDAVDIPPQYTDEGKVSQILRNFISNALKFTEAGEVRVSVEYLKDEDTFIYRVRDTGIGIPAEHHELIFQEFSQVDNPLQRGVKGTGLGLPLSRRLAELMGGSVGLTSRPGAGSEFFLRIPRAFGEDVAAPVPDEAHAPERPAVLIVEDRHETRMAYEKYLLLSPWRVLSARTVRETEGILRHTKPVAIVLDIELHGEHAWDLLARIKSTAELKNIPVIVAPTMHDPAKAMALGADLYLDKPVSGPALRAALRKVTGTEIRNILVVDDQDVSRYLARQMFDVARANFIEAADGAQALEMARAEKPDLVLADLMMPHMSGFDLLDGMRGDTALRDVPVIVMTSKTLSPDEKSWLQSRTLAILGKDRLMDGEGARTLAAVLPSVGLEDLIDPARAAAARPGQADSREAAL